MNKKVMLEFPNGKRRWGYVSDEVIQNKLGFLTLFVGNVEYNVDDIKKENIQIVSTDKEIVDTLLKMGYLAVHRKGKVTSHTINFPPDLYNKITEISISTGKTINQTVLHLLTESFK